ncbi:aminotransferase class IV [Paractinoplanes atraurantiacus]|uniref:Branched-chain amino acid aminotransferase/4-amino-4-deoxychorismate lyase n=1 Tax=Paractinoplanes atraurantiacus TaxID=1036182 RepID=A0A285J3J5_9ACTN|nr:aminotransferase class IV [Actinoplanes atraurantiacus]SNY54905.1 Branched-chain amino acid aminotransferase/4-amino-4-deoxychorismate lyase [Actinoplanes atraurantiacus]
MTYVEINGAPPSLEAVHRAATWNYGHFSSMQVRRRAVAGLELHLRRLREASAVLFPDATPPTDDTVVRLIGQALGDRQDASVRVTVLPGLDVMVSISDPVADTPRAPLRVRTVVYERELPELKHVATMGLTYHSLQARRAGFDDVLFLGADGGVREGSVWNVVFSDGERVVWPEAPMLTGVTMQVLRRGLDKLGVPSERRGITSLEGLRAAAAANSHCPAQPLASVDNRELPDHAPLTDLLWQAWREVTWDVI